MKESSHNIAKSGETQAFLVLGYYMQVIPCSFYCILTAIQLTSEISRGQYTNSGQPQSPSGYYSRGFRLLAGTITCSRELSPDYINTNTFIAFLWIFIVTRAPFLYTANLSIRSSATNRTYSPQSQ